AVAHARGGSRRRGRDRRAAATQRQRGHLLPPRRHVPAGYRPGRGGRPAPAGPWRRRPAGGRRVRDAVVARGEHQRHGPRHRRTRRRDHHRVRPRGGPGAHRLHHPGALMSSTLPALAVDPVVGAERLTLASAWQAISGRGFTDELLAWPPDVFAVTNVLLDRSEAFRFVLSPPAGMAWPPAGAGDWSDA